MQDVVLDELQITAEIKEEKKPEEKPKFLALQVN